MAAVVLVAGGRAQPAKTSSIAHHCGAQDRQFIHAAVLANTQIAMVGQDYVSGDIAPGDAVAQTRNAALAIRITDPRDPSLKLARTLMHSMAVEYGLALRAKWKGGNPGKHMYRSYSLANYANQVLTDARPALDAAGCSVGELLSE